MKKNQYLEITNQLSAINKHLVHLDAFEEAIAIYNETGRRIQEMNRNLETLNNILKSFPELINKTMDVEKIIRQNNELKTETNKHVEALLKEVNYANQRLED